MGTGPVKGFGVTLTIGVALSLFTALVVTRLIFDFLLNRGWLNKVGMLHIIKNPEWDFMKWTKLAYHRLRRSSSWSAWAMAFSSRRRMSWGRNLPAATPSPSV